MTPQRYEGKNSEVIQHQNRLLVLRIIREKKEISRVKLSEITGLKQATITNIVNQLLELDYVIETGLIGGSNGRRVKGIRLNDEKMKILITRITSEYFAVGVYNLYGSCISVEKVFWEDSNQNNKLEVIAFKMLQCIENNRNEITSAGIVIQGSISDLCKKYDYAYSENIEAFLYDYFREKLQVEIYVNNVSNMSAFYEWEKLNLQNIEVKTLVCLMVGYAVDCSVLYNGRVVKGRNGRAGHFGHVSIDINGPLCECGNRGCIKNYISVEAIRKRCSELKDRYPNSNIDENSNIREIYNAYFDKDEMVLVIYEEVAEVLGMVVANLINQFNPDRIIIGDEIPNDDTFLDKIKYYAAQRLPEDRYVRVNIDVFKETRRTQNDVGMRGMCLYAINEQLNTMEL